MSTIDDNVTISADGIEIHADEKVSTGDYETSTVGATMDASVEGIDLTGGVPDDLKMRVYSLQRTLQNVAKRAAEERKKEATDD